MVAWAAVKASSWPDALATRDRVRIITDMILAQMLASGTNCMHPPKATSVFTLLVPLFISILFEWLF
jgi:hypothetical protein